MENDKNEPDNERNEKGFKLGYDIGFALSEVEPDAIRLLTELESKAPILEGIRSGREAFDRERNSQASLQMPEWLKTERQKGTFNDKAQRQNNPDIEPER